MLNRSPCPCSTRPCATASRRSSIVCLRVLQDHPGIDQVTLARLCALDTSTAADLAVRLEERGLVRRMMPMKSKRYRLLHLTPEGADSREAAHSNRVRVKPPLASRAE